MGVLSLSEEKMEMGCGDVGGSGRLELVSKIRLFNLNMNIQKEKKRKERCLQQRRSSVSIR